MWRNDDSNNSLTCKLDKIASPRTVGIMLQKAAKSVLGPRFFFCRVNGWCVWKNKTHDGLREPWSLIMWRLEPLVLLISLPVFSASSHPLGISTLADG